FHSLAETKIGRHGGNACMQPDVVPIEWNEPERHVKHRNESHHGQRTIEERQSSDELAGAGVILRIRPGCDSDSQVYEVMEPIDGEQPQQQTVTPVNSQIRKPRRRSRLHSREETDCTDQNKYDGYDFCKAPGGHNNSFLTLA